MGLDLSQAATLIAEFEGFRSMPYQDAASVWTVGYGETDPAVVNVARADGITQAAAFALLERRVQGFWDAIQGGLGGRDLNSNQAAAVTSLAYNIGAGAFVGSTVARCIRAGDFAGAAAAFLAWDRAGGQILPGLLRRRQMEAALFVTPPGPAAQPAAVTTTTTTQEDEMLHCTDPINGNQILADPGGGVFVRGPDGGDPKIDGFLGNLFGHPDWKAGGGQANGPVVAIGCFDDGNPTRSAYTLITRDAAGNFHGYAFKADGSMR